MDFNSTPLEGQFISVGHWTDRVQDVKSINISPMLQQYLFYTAVAFLVVHEGYKFTQDAIIPLWQALRSFVSAVTTVVRDFRSGTFYKPWPHQKPIVLPPTKRNLLELGETPILSQRAVYADMFGFKMTMNKFPHNEQVKLRSRLWSRVVAVNGPIYLNVMFDSLRERMLSTFSGFAQTARVGPRDSFTIPCAQIAREMALRMMSVAFFGNELASDKTFSDALLRYPKDMATLLVAFQVTPSFCSKLVHRIVTRNGKAMQTIQDRLTEIIASDCRDDTWGEERTTKENTILYNVAKLRMENDYWSPELLSQALLGIWFAASHQPWLFMATVLLELCRRPEWQSELRGAIGDFDELDYQKLESIPILDSFIKECIRTNPLDTLVVRRKALKDFKFTEGTELRQGQVACVSLYNLLHDPKHYDSPNTFDGSRFTRQAHDKDRRFTGVSEHFAVWGVGSLVCPGRFYASTVIKMFVAFLLKNYDLSLEDDSKPLRWKWESLTIPYESTRVVLTKRSA